MTDEEKINIGLGYTVGAARYAKGMLAVRPCEDGSGWKTLAGLLISQLNPRWSNREKAYIVTPAKVRKFAVLVEESKERRRAILREDEAATLQ